MTITNDTLFGPFATPHSWIRVTAYYSVARSSYHCMHLLVGTLLFSKTIAKLVPNVDNNYVLSLATAERLTATMYWSRENFGTQSHNTAIVQYNEHELQ